MDVQTGLIFVIDVVVVWMAALASRSAVFGSAFFKIHVQWVKRWLAAAVYRLWCVRIVQKNIRRPYQKTLVASLGSNYVRGEWFFSVRRHITTGATEVRFFQRTCYVTVIVGTVRRCMISLIIYRIPFHSRSLKIWAITVLCHILPLHVWIVTCCSRKYPLSPCDTLLHWRTSGDFGCHLSSDASRESQLQSSWFARQSCSWHPRNK